MARRVSALDELESRRRKEYLAFLVVKFLNAHESFRSIHGDFLAAVKANALAESGLYKRVWGLVENMAFDMKEKAHYLFRSTSRNGKRGDQKTDEKGTRRMIEDLKSSIEARSIDSYIGTGYHLLLILGESLYQLERYAPEFRKEQDQAARIERLARRVGYTFNPDELAELEHLKALSDISMKVNAETEELIFRFMVRCESLFSATAEMIRHFIEGAGDNEVLIQNLLQNAPLLEKVYGEGSAEKIFWTLCRGKRLEGQTGLEKATSYARARCGNITALPAKGPAS